MKNEFRKVILTRKKKNLWNADRRPIKTRSQDTMPGGYWDHSRIMRISQTNCQPLKTLLLQLSRAGFVRDNGKLYPITNDFNLKKDPFFDI